MVITQKNAELIDHPLDRAFIVPISTVEGFAGVWIG
jgi:hypothetical protein